MIRKEFQKLSYDYNRRTYMLELKLPHTKSKLFAHNKSDKLERLGVKGILTLTFVVCIHAYMFRVLSNADDWREKTTLYPLKRSSLC